MPPVYLDCAATAPVDPRVREVVLRHLDDDIGNAGSRQHDHGRRAQAAVERARDQLAAAVGCSRGDVIFTSGATESNNLALLGLAAHGERTGRRHIVSTGIEHHAVLEPLAALARRGFEVALVPPDAGGRVPPEAIIGAVRPDTLLVSVMHVNNETGIMQPVAEIAGALADQDVWLHVDAAQGFGLLADALTPRIDLISISGHKLHAPPGVGALIRRRRDGRRPPLEPLLFGGGQERGARPGTVPVAMVAGFGAAVELARAEADGRRAYCADFGDRLLAGLARLEPIVHGDARWRAPHLVSLSIPGVDAGEAMEAWRDLAAVSHGAACTTQRRTCSHVLTAMGLDDAREAEALRLSWSHLTGLPDLEAMVAAIVRLRTAAGSPVP